MAGTGHFPPFFDQEAVVILLSLLIIIKAKLLKLYYSTISRFSRMNPKVPSHTYQLTGDRLQLLRSWLAPQALPGFQLLQDMTSIYEVRLVKSCSLKNDLNCGPCYQRSNGDQASGP